MTAVTGGNRDAAGREARTALIRLRPRPESAASARYFTAAVLESWRVADRLVQDVLLAVSELVTNAVEHGVGEVVLELINLGGRCLRVQVSDQGLGAHPSLVPLSPSTPRSRGLAIVAAVSSKWGHRGHDGGLCVWAEFSLLCAD
ncbi:ATP-binding protein [Actinokineospora sp. UTMC 2448]|uniref:ATP-binding protein n=1 Tax=Actinokineospora sp. UTMC 2448 TaxID=2268449 RepID=UPI0021643147|nr:ATP-binding protein [Actinokineospora sp. UTMC 2448]UVS80964.1 Signal transduction histidine kinase [Actinokineospora sp. UTMC 2448]